ncbi:hypothetical protein Vadar_032509 [Vaccinium darrowii]|uniref:Uncharacterized protein n=1 Tax=Vaccinium darrowii TaxID=229202 RepID=A0ACB7YIR9_9ERIC|nr:hypothetical protein Vadar_032509 [Vaccinium darrowii]
MRDRDPSEPIGSAKSARPRQGVLGLIGAPVQQRAFGSARSVRIDKGARFGQGARSARSAWLGQGPVRQGVPQSAKSPFGKRMSGLAKGPFGKECPVRPRCSFGKECPVRHRECPEECKEALSSLMFAAARFADMPELRELRSVSADRYRNSIETNVNEEGLIHDLSLKHKMHGSCNDSINPVVNLEEKKLTYAIWSHAQFVEKPKAQPPTKELKLQLIQERALESDLQWDSKALEQKLCNPPASAQAHSKNKSDEKYNAGKGIKEPVIKIDKQVAENRQQNVRDSASRGNKEELPSYGRKKFGDDILGGSIDQTTDRNVCNAMLLRKIQMTRSSLRQVKSSETEKSSSEVPSADGEDNHHGNNSVAEEAKTKISSKETFETSTGSCK